MEEPIAYRLIIDWRRRSNCAIYFKEKEIAAADKKRRNSWIDERSSKKANAISSEEEEEEEEEETPGSLPFMKPKDHQYFGWKVDNDKFCPTQHEEVIVMKLLLKLKNGTPNQKKTALRQLIDNAKVFGADPLFRLIFTLLLHHALDDQERYLLVKAFSRIVYELDELVRPYVYIILGLTQPLLVDEHQEYNPRFEGIEIIHYLSKAAGLAAMIDVIRPVIGSCEEYIRKAAARAVSVVASALGIPAVLPFLREACQNHDISWRTRYTGIMMVQQIIVLIDSDVLLPHLRSLADIIQPHLEDDFERVRTITCLTLAALAQAAAPYEKPKERRPSNMVYEPP